MKGIEIFFYDCRTEKWKDVLVSENASFHQILEILHMDTDMLVFEKASMELCDKDISINRLGVQAGMMFLLY